jgi:hypothetical protein
MERRHARGGAVGGGGRCRGGEGACASRRRDGAHIVDLRAALRPADRGRASGTRAPGDSGRTAGLCDELYGSATFQAPSACVLPRDGADALGRRGAARVPRHGCRCVERRHGALERGHVAAGLHFARTASVRNKFSPNSHIEVQYVVNRKVVDLATLYNFCKGRLVFFSTDFAGTLCQH